MFATNDVRIKHSVDLNELMAPVLAGQSVREWLRRFDEVGVPAGEVKTFDHVYSTEQVRQQNLVWTAEHSTLGTIELPGSPLRFGRSEAALRLAPPTLGEHSDEIRREFAADPSEDQR
jgi:crotonobetainyl-CoA:carnitine CoA-transferase CaiB-like acyl-CoA transferase